MNIGEYCLTSNYARNKNDKKLLLKRFGYKVMTIYLLQVLIYAHLTCIFNIVTNCDRICENQTMDNYQLWLTWAITVLLHKKLH